MSSTLKWEPVIERGDYLSDELKYLLRQKYGDPIEKTTLQQWDITYLYGLRDGCTDKPIKKEIEKLIKAIETYEAITIWESY